MNTNTTFHPLQKWVIVPKLETLAYRQNEIELSHKKKGYQTFWYSVDDPDCPTNDLDMFVDLCERLNACIDNSVFFFLSEEVYEQFIAYHYGMNAVEGEKSHIWLCGSDYHDEIENSLPYEELYEELLSDLTIFPTPILPSSFSFLAGRAFVYAPHAFEVDVDLIQTVLEEKGYRYTSNVQTLLPDGLHAAPTKTLNDIIEPYAEILGLTETAHLVYITNGIRKQEVWSFAIAPSETVVTLQNELSGISEHHNGEFEQYSVSADRIEELKQEFKDPKDLAVFLRAVGVSEEEVNKLCGGPSFPPIAALDCDLTTNTITFKEYNVTVQLTAREAAFYKVIYDQMDVEKSPVSDNKVTHLFPVVYENARFTRSNKFTSELTPKDKADIRTKIKAKLKRELLSTYQYYCIEKGEDGYYIKAYQGENN